MKVFILVITLMYFTLNKFNIVSGLSVSHNSFMIIQKHFKSSAVAHLYFCNRKDAITAMKSTINAAFLFGYYFLYETNLKKNILKHKTSHTGIFVDLTCEKGVSFINQSASLFNGSYIWLLWTSDHNQTLETLKPTRVMLDSRVTLASRKKGNEIMLFEVFRIHSTFPFSITKVARFSENNIYDQLMVPPKRDDLKGVVLRASVVIEDKSVRLRNPMPPLVKRSNSGFNANTGLSIELFLVLAEILNLKYNYTQAETWGYPQADGKWSGAIGQLLSGTTDIALCLTLYFHWRLSVADYFLPSSELK